MSQTDAALLQLLSPEARVVLVQAAGALCGYAEFFRLIDLPETAKVAKRCWRKTGETSRAADGMSTYIFIGMTLSLSVSGFAMAALGMPGAVSVLLLAFACAIASLLTREGEILHRDHARYSRRLGCHK